MLWQKHMVKGKDMYVDLLNKNEMRSFTKEFSQKLKTFEEQCAYLGKSNAFSQEIRGEGNQLYTNGDYEASLDAYNRAITFAEVNSEYLGICYGNRSACFFELKCYSQCLIDIELAKENNYPIHLTPKLDQRKAECLKFIENEKELIELCHETPKLSFEPHLEFPCFANEIEVNFSNITGTESNITTNVDLEIGQTIIIERAMAFTPAGGNEMGYCHYCFKRNVNLIPCQTCIFAMFCSSQCYNAANAYHQIVCGVEHFFSTSVLYESLRTLIFAINIFSTIENLMSAIENFRNSREGATHQSDPAQQQYFQFFGLRSIVHLMTDAEQIQIKKYALEVAMFIKHASKLKAIFQSTKMFQFLLHLSLHHIGIICSNGYNAFQYYSGSSFKWTLGIEGGKPQKHFGSGIAPYSSQLKHSCVPNVCRIFINDTIVYRVIRSIKRGEQLCVSYLDPLQLLLPTIVREMPLSNRYHLKCNCVSCTSNYPPFTATGNNQLDTVTQLLSLMEGVPNEFLNKSLLVSPTELRQFENATINFLRSNDHVHPTEETLKMQYILTQIWNLIMR